MGSSATLGDGLAEACQRSLSCYDDGAADGTAGLAGTKVRALVRGEAASGASVPARSADNGPGIHMAKIAVGAQTRVSSKKARQNAVTVGGVSHYQTTSPGVPRWRIRESEVHWERIKQCEWTKRRVG